MADDQGMSTGAELKKGVDMEGGKPVNLKLKQDENGAPDSHLAEWVRAPAKYIKKEGGKLKERTAIDQVTIHTLVIDLTAAKWVEKVRAGTTSKNDIPHYVVGSELPSVYQVAREKYFVSHASDVNDSAIGIEHQGRANDPKYYPPSLYRRSAELVREICQRRNIPIDRQHIRGHQEFPKDGHDDPGGYWDWEYYIALVNGQDPIRLILGEEEPEERRPMFQACVPRFSTRKWSLYKRSLCGLESIAGLHLRYRCPRSGNVVPIWSAPKN